MPVSAVNVEKPVVQRVLRGSTKSLYNVLHHSVLGQSGRYLSKNKAVQIQLGQLALPLIAGLALLYTQGREAMQPNGDRRHWFKAMAEAVGGFTMINHASGLFPLYAMAIGAYRSGQQPDKLSKAQEWVKTGIIALLAWSEAADKIDEMDLRKLLEKNTGIERSMAGITASSTGNKTAEELADEALVKLRDTLKTLRRSSIRTGANTDTSAQTREALAKAKTELLEHLRTLEKHAPSEKGLIDSLEKTLSRHFGAKSKVPARLAEQLNLLGTAVRSSEEGYIKLVRRMNPIFGYLIMGSLVGIPLAKKANQWLEQRFPQWRQKSGPQFFNPYPKNPPRNNTLAGPSITIPGIGTYR